jgi:hypothetical protein
MSDIVNIDLSSAGITYRTAVGEQRCVPAGEVVLSALFGAASWRTFRWWAPRLYRDHCGQLSLTSEHQAPEVLK